MLSVSIEGFGCYRIETIFTFDGPGLVLLQGESGSGKTTILESIAFALYGDIKKISWGEKTCKVILTYDGWTVTRSKGPNRLVLMDNETNEEYEEREAQDLIDEKYGTNFSITSYITQGGACSFFSLKPAARMVFLEQLALGDVPIAEIKKKCSAKIRERKTKLSERVGELKVISDEASKLVEPEQIPFPLVGKYSEIKVKNEAILKKKNTKALSKTTKELTDLIAQQAQYELQKQKREQLNVQLYTGSQQLLVYETELHSLPNHNTLEIEDRLKVLNLNKELVKLKTTCNSDAQQYKAMCAIEISQLQDEYDQLFAKPIIKDIADELQQKAKIKERLLKLKSKISSCSAAIDDLDTSENYSIAIRDLQEQEQELMTQKLKLKDRTVIHKCPKCETFLRIGKSGLELTDHSTGDELRSEKEIDKDLKQARSDRSDYEDNLRELKTLQSDLLKMTKEYDSLPVDMDVSINYESQYNAHKDVLREQDAQKDRIAQLKRKIDNEEVSAATQAVARRLELKRIEIKKTEANLSGLSPECDLRNKDDPDALQQDLFTAKTTDQIRDRLSLQIKQLKAQLSSLRKQIDLIACDETDYDSLVKEKNNEIKELKVVEKGFRDREPKLVAFLAYQQKQELYDKWQTKLKDSQCEEENAKRSLGVAEKFLRKIRETECAAVINTIDVINCHMRYYLDEFFSEPIEVEINSFKEVKTSGEEKPIVNVKIFYKGFECDVKELSGGEKARLDLAICLSINSMAGGSLILLDESFSSLNSQITEDILELLKEKVRETGKLVISVCHQTNTSNFDSMVDL